MSDTSPTPPATQEIPLSQIFAIFWRGRWIILLCTLLALGGGYWWAQRRGTIYRATSRVYVEKSTPSIISAESLLGVSDSRSYANTQAQLLRSMHIFAKALGSDALRGNAILAGHGNKVAYLKKALRVSVGKKDDIITVSLDNKLKDEAASIVNAVVTAYITTQNAKRKDTAADVLKHLENKKSEHSKELTGSLQELTDFQKDNGFVSVDGRNLRVLTTRLESLSNELAKAEMARLDAESAFKAVQGLETDPETLRIVASMMLGINSPIESRDANSARLELDKLRARLRDLTVELTEEHPQVIALAKTVEDLATGKSSTTKRLAKAYVQALSQRFARAKAKEEQLGRQHGELKKRLIDLNSKDADFRLIEEKVAHAKSMLQKIDERIRVININEVNTDTTRIQVLDEADELTTTVASSKTRTTALFTMLGLLLGLGLAWLRGLLDQRLRTLDDVAEGGGVNPLGIMPRTKLPDGSILETWEENRQLAEATRSLRTAVYFGLHEQSASTVHVTSPDPGDGKSLTSAGLAIAMAQAGQRTLLLDGDMRKPRQHKMFGLQNEVGLSTVLAGIDKSKAAIQHTPLEDLHVLTAGPIPPNPAELLNSPGFKKLLDDLSRYDRIIIDSPPVLPVADARIIASKADMSVMVLRVDKSTRKRASAAAASLESVNASVLGAVLNDMPKGIGYGYGSGYGYYDYKYYGDERADKQGSRGTGRKVAS